MLLESERHREEDIALWQELEAADRVHAKSNIVRRRVAETMRAIAEFHSRGRRYYVATSWGKDSTMLCHIFLPFRPTVIWIRELGADNPDSTKVRDAFLSQFPVEYEEVSYPFTTVLDGWRKWNSATKRLSKERGVIVMGLRADESPGRMKRFQVHGPETATTFAPLQWATCSDVFAYLADHDLPIHPAYAMLGGGRWPREKLRVDMLGYEQGRNFGREEWEREYYGDVLGRMKHAQAS